MRQIWISSLFDSTYIAGVSQLSVVLTFPKITVPSMLTVTKEFLIDASATLRPDTTIHRDCQMGLDQQDRTPLTPQTCHEVRVGLRLSWLLSVKIIHIDLGERGVLCARHGGQEQGMRGQ